MLNILNNDKPLVYKKPENIRVDKGLKIAIDQMYWLYGNLNEGDKAVFHGKQQWKLVVDRVSRGCICLLMDQSLYTLHHNEELLAFHTAKRYAGFDPKLLKKRYAVSNILKSTLQDAAKHGIDLRTKPEIIKHH